MSIRGLLKVPSHLGASKFAAEVKGKTVAVVGNANSLFGRNLGPEIDQHDVIIRINRGFVRKPMQQGSRTDIVGTSRPIRTAQIVERYRPKRVMWLFWRWWRLPTWTPEIWRKTEVIPLALWHDAYKKIKWRPTSGFVMLNLLINHTEAKQISIYGFDFYETPNFYRPEKNRPGVHSPEIEKLVLLEMIKTRPTVKII